MIKTEELDKDYSKNQPRKQIPLSLGRTAAATFYLFYQHLLGWKAAKQHTIHFKVRCFKAGWNEFLNLLRRDELEQQTVCSSVHQNETSDHKEILVSDADTKLPRNLHSTIKKKTLNPTKIFSCFNHIFKIFSPVFLHHSLLLSTSAANETEAIWTTFCFSVQSWFLPRAQPSLSFLQNEASGNSKQSCKQNLCPNKCIKGKIRSSASPTS